MINSVKTSIKTFGKYLDQPMLIAKLNKNMPKIMAIGGLGFMAHDAYVSSKDRNESNKKEKNKEFIRKSIILGTTITSALLAPKIASKITKRTPLMGLDAVKANNTKLIDKFLSKNEVSKTSQTILTDAKEKPIKLKDLKTLMNDVGKKPDGKKFIDKLIPEPENVKAKDIFSEIGYLSVYGAVPVVGGIAGGIMADRVCDKEHYKEKIPNKINEGIYQYLANIFMCNIGAGTALHCLEKANIKSKSARAIGMTAGIILTGVIGGSKVANCVAKNVIAPITAKITGKEYKKEEVKERTPEPLDMCLHTDDIATVSLLSGLKWIEPSLPILYSVSGYRAGSGYRN